MIKRKQMVFKSYLALKYNCSNQKKFVRVPTGSLCKKNSPGRKMETNILLSLA